MPRFSFTLRRYVQASAIAACLFTGACSGGAEPGGQVGASPAEQPATNVPVAVDTDSVLPEATEQPNNAPSASSAIRSPSSYSMHTSVTVETAPARPRIVLAESFARSATGNASRTMDLNGRARRVEMRLLESQLIARLKQEPRDQSREMEGIYGPEDPWILVDVTEAEAEDIFKSDEAPPLHIDPDDPASLLSLIAGSGEIEVVGPVVDGEIQTTHYRGWIGPDVAELAHDWRQRLTIEETLSSLRLRNFTGMPIPIELWVGDDGFLRRVSYTVDLSQTAIDEDFATLAPQGIVRFERLYFDVNEEVIIWRPTNREVVGERDAAGVEFLAQLDATQRAEIFAPTRPPAAVTTPLPDPSESASGLEPVIPTTVPAPPAAPSVGTGPPSDGTRIVAEVSSFRMEQTMSAGLRDVRIESDVVIVSKAANGDAAMLVDSIAMADPIELRRIGTQVFAHGPVVSERNGIAESWVVHDDPDGDIFGEEDVVLATPLFVDVNDPTSLVRIGAGGGQMLDMAGRVNLDGVPTTVFSGYLDSGATTKAKTWQQRVAMEETLATLGLDDFRGDAILLDVWVGDDGFVRRVRYSFEQTETRLAQGLADHVPEGTVVVDRRYFNVNGAVVIEPPPAADVIAAKKPGI